MKLGPEVIHTHALVSVNGYIHNTGSSAEYSWIAGGAETVRRSGKSEISITSFLDVGSLQKIQIDKSMLTAPAGAQGYRNLVRISVPTSLEGKSFFLVLGGYIVTPGEGSFWKDAGDHLYFNVRSIPYIERILESSKVLDLSSLGVPQGGVTSAGISTDEIWSDEAIAEYMTLPQSFLVIVDADNLFFNTRLARCYRTPGVYSDAKEPTLPLLVGSGKIAEYWKIYEDGMWAMVISDCFARRYEFLDDLPGTALTAAPAFNLGDPNSISEARFLEIGVYF